MLEALLENAGVSRSPLLTDRARVWMVDGVPKEARFSAVPKKGCLEVLFCRRGRVAAHFSPGCQWVLEPGKAFFLPGRAGECFCQFYPERFQGVLVSGEEQAALAALKTLCPGLRNFPPDSPHGCAVIDAGFWMETFFSALDQLPSQRKGDYCVIKSVELLYLLHAGGKSRPRSPGGEYYDKHQRQAVQEVHDYMLGHLDQRLTIAGLSKRFRVSGTALKACFRQLYGMPLHQYLLERRMEEGARLLASTGQTVVQVAASVGYSSASQFSVAFKARYQMTPAQYRRASKKMSVSVESRPNPGETHRDGGV